MVIKMDELKEEIHEVKKEIEILKEHKIVVESALEKIRDNIHILLSRNADILVKVINGRTTERLASELIAEMYMDIKSLKESKPTYALKKFGEYAMHFINITTALGVIWAIIKLSALK